MIDDFMELLINSGVTTKGGQDFNSDGQNLIYNLIGIDADATPRQLAEVLAQFLTMPAPPELIVGEPAGTARYNLNFNFSASDLTNVSDGDVNRMADRARQFLVRLSEDNENEE